MTRRRRQVTLTDLLLWECEQEEKLLMSSSFDSDQRKPLTTVQLAEIRDRLNGYVAADAAASVWRELAQTFADYADVLLAEVERLRKDNFAAWAFVYEAAGDHEHKWNAIDPQEVWYCTICHEISQDYAEETQKQARMLLAEEEGNTEREALR